MRDIITLACEQCKNRNYTTTKNKRKTPDKLAFKKYCPFCRTHTYIRKQNRAFVKCRPVALTARAPDSKSGCWGFESLLACQCSYLLMR